MADRDRALPEIARFRRHSGGLCGHSDGQRQAVCLRRFDIREYWRQVKQAGRATIEIAARILRTGLPEFAKALRHLLPYRIGESVGQFAIMLVRNFPQCLPRSACRLSHLTDLGISQIYATFNTLDISDVEFTLDGARPTQSDLFNLGWEKEMQLKKVVLIGLSLAAVFSAGIAIGAQPHMQNALRSLQDAKSELQQAGHNKGRHRARAIALIEEAISEVKEGIRDGRD